MLVAKDTKIVHLKLQHQKLSSEGPDIIENLTAETKKVNDKIVELTSEVQGLNAEEKTLTKEL